MNGTIHWGKRRKTSSLLLDWSDEDVYVVPVTVKPGVSDPAKLISSALQRMNRRPNVWSADGQTAHSLLELKRGAEDEGWTAVVRVVTYIGS